MKTKLLTLISLPLLAIGLSSCTPNTPQTRIQKHPKMYENQSARNQEFIQQGRIAKGMSKDAVYLAWGAPDQELSGYKNNSEYALWRYTTSIPVYRTGFYGSYGYGWGRRGYRRFPYGIGMAPEVYYVRRTKANVEFRNNRVKGWEQVR